MSASSEGAAALLALDRALATKPAKDGQAFAETTERLCRLRDALIGAPDARARVNAIISASLAGHFPLGDLPWPEVEQARAMLAELMREVE